MLEYPNGKPKQISEPLNLLASCIASKRNFLLEAGAGAGKTYSLIKALRQIIETQATTFTQRKQRVACITYTNIAKEEIESRIDRHPIVFSATIHSFCWELIQNFKKNLLELLPELNNWPNRITEAQGIKKQIIQYDLGYPHINQDYIYLGHDDVINLTVKLFGNEKFRSILTNKFPIILIDEYQDTSKLFVEMLKEHFIDKKVGPLIGFFGDNWQKIYGSESCGQIVSQNLEKIENTTNFRSCSEIVNALNKLRPDLQQKANNQNETGNIQILHTNKWNGIRRSESHWKDDLPADIAHSYLEQTKQNLAVSGWDFSLDKTKILMLTHNLLADNQGYQNLLEVFPRKDSLIKKEDPYISYFVDLLEPACNAFTSKKFGNMFKILGQLDPKIEFKKDKEKWRVTMNSLNQLRKNKLVGDIINFLKTNELLPLPQRILKKEEEFLISASLAEKERPDSISKIAKLKAVPYKEVSNFFQYDISETAFATQHGVKGAEFENVLIVIGRGWNHYNFNQMLEWTISGVPQDKKEAYERNRNLFYVICSRAKNRLAILFTQKLTDQALEALSIIFNKKNIHPV